MLSARANRYDANTRSNEADGNATDSQSSVKLEVNNIGRQVTVYTTPACDYCRQLKRFLSENGVEYKEVDVSTDYAAAVDVVRRTNQHAVPVVDIDGMLVVGFDGPQLRTLLHIDQAK